MAKFTQQQRETFIRALTKVSIARTLLSEAANDLRDLWEPAWKEVASASQTATSSLDIGFNAMNSEVPEGPWPPKMPPPVEPTKTE